VVSNNPIGGAFTKTRVDRYAMSEDRIVESRSKGKLFGESALCRSVLDEFDRKEQTSTSDLANVAVLAERFDQLLA
jgi:hypothetical protein